MLERFTHNRRGEIIDVYTSFEWPTLCRAVSCLKVDLERGTRIDLPRLGNRVWETFLDTEVDPARKLNDFNPKMVEAVGIENIGFRTDSGNYG